MRVLIVDKHNDAYSQMLERWLHDISLAKELEVFSAGTQPASEINPWVIMGMEERSMSVAKMFPKHLSHFRGQSFDLLFYWDAAICSKIHGYDIHYLKKTELNLSTDSKFVIQPHNRDTFLLMFASVASQYAAAFALIKEWNT